MLKAGRGSELRPVGWGHVNGYGKAAVIGVSATAHMLPAQLPFPPSSPDLQLTPNGSGWYHAD